MRLPDWWPDWKGETVAIIASGPSAKDAPVEMLRGKAKVITINTSWQLAPWADILFACDVKWWNTYKGCPEFKGLKLCVEKEAVRRWGAGYVRCEKPHDRFLLSPKGTVGWGGNSGFHCLNLAVQFEAAKVILVGYDMHLNRGKHWHPDHPAGMNNPSVPNVARWRRAVDSAAKVIPPGVRVINCSPVSALTAYPKMTMEEALAA